MYQPTTIQQFNDFVASPNETLVYYTATWCGPCKKVTPVIAASTKRRMKVDAGENEDIFVHRQVQTIPCIEVWRDGKLLEKVEGHERVTMRLQKTDQS